MTITVQSDFDAKLTLRDARGEVLAEDDDSGGDLRPLLKDIRLPENGSYVILVTGVSDVDQGAFTLTLTVR